MSKLPFFMGLIFSIFLTPMLFAQEGEEEITDTREKSSITLSKAKIERFQPRIILMRPSVLFFEEGFGISVDQAIAQQAIEDAYLYIEEYFAPRESQDIFTKESNAFMLTLIQQERNRSIAQVFARQNGEEQYLFINVFPSRSIAGDQTRLNSQVWRPQKVNSPAFWRIRYNLTTQTFYSFSYDLPT